jgi:PAS domain S-box-containing protein
LGVTVLAGWFFHNPTLVQLQPQLPPTTRNAAACLLLCGLALLMEALRGPRWLVAACAGIVGAVSVLTIVEYVFRVNAGIDELLGPSYIAVKLSSPGRMAPAAAICFTLGSIGLLLVPRVLSKRSALLIGLIGSIIAAVGMASSIGFALGTSDAFGWGTVTRVAFHTSVGLSVFGAGMLALAWHVETDPASSPRWLPISVAIGIATATVGLWQALIAARYAPSALLPTVVLSGGCLMALIFGLTVYLAQRAYVQAAALRQSEASLRQIATLAQKSEYYLAEAERLGHIGSYASSARVNPPENLHFSAEMFRILGFPPGGVPPTTEEAGRVFTAAGPENWPRIMELFETARREKIADGEFPAVLPDGSNRMIRIVAHTVYDPAGEPNEFIGTCVDVTEQHQARTELQKAFNEIRRSEDQLRAFINTIPAFVWSARPDGSVDFFNQLYLDYAGLSAEQAIDWGWTVSLHPDDQDSVTDFRRAVLDSGKPGEMEARLRRFDGEYRWFLFRVNPVHDESGKVVKWYGTNADIEDRRRAEEALRAREQDLSLIIETIPGLVWCATPEGELNYLNRRILDYTGTTLGDWAQNGWTNFIYPDDVEPAMRAWSHAVATGELYAIQCRFRRSDGAYRWFQVLGQAARDKEGGVTRWYGLLIDIDDRRNMEEALRSNEARLSRATQIAAVGELSASIAHEINQPLAAVVSNGHACLRWLSAEPPGLAKAFEAAERIVRDGKEAGEVVRRIRALFKRAPLEKIQLDLNEVIGEVVRLMGSETTKRRIVVETDLGKDLVPVTGDRVQLQQLVFNLLLNGIEAMELVPDRSKKLFIRTKLHSLQTVLVEIRDNGIGLEDSTKAFEAFFTTKENGMGMGLAVCRSIIDAHRGRLWASPGEGAGTTFSFTLPVQAGVAS